MNDRQQRRQVTVEVDGRPCSGNYWIAGKILVVSTAKGGSSHQLGTKVPQELAEQLLRKLAGEGKA